MSKVNPSRKLFNSFMGRGLQEGGRSSWFMDILTGVVLTKLRPCACIAGFVADLDAWVDFDNQWKVLLSKPEWPTRVREVHMYDLAHAEKEFEGWSYASRLALFGDCIGVISTSDIHAIGSTVWVHDFNRLSDDEKQLLAFKQLRTPNDIAFQHLMQIVIRRASEKYPDEKHVGIMFDI